MEVSGKEKGRDDKEIREGERDIKGRGGREEERDAHNI